MKRLFAILFCVALLVGVLWVPAMATPSPKVNICHRDQGKPEWKVIEIAKSALPAHLAHQWGADIYPVPEAGCPATPTATPEPTATSTPVPTATSTLEPTPTRTADPTATPTRPVVCKPHNVGTWYECNTGNSTYTATSGEKCWCGGLTGRVHYHTIYDCGQTYVEEGNWLNAPKTLGYYSAPICAIGGWCAK